MANAHGTFEALGPVNWDHIAHDDIETFLTSVFADAQCLVDSIPVSLASLEQKFGRQRSATESDLPSLLSRAPRSTERARELRKEWKEVKVNPRENPLGLDVYKLAAKDGKGAWFARRSVHEGLTFEKWKLGVEKEFAESMKVQGKPGDGNIRGIGAEKRVVNQTVESCGKMEVYQLSAQFPGPTTPRDFVTLLLSSDSTKTTPISDGARHPRYYMVVSKPCVHPECPQRQGFIRGQYESVEFIREIKVDKPLRKIRSSIDLSNEDSVASAKDAADSMSKEAMMRSARQAAVSNSSIHNENGRPRGRTIAFSGTNNGQLEDEEDYDTMIEWVMVTRSDPGGSVPRFMIERGTPAGIAGDANKFLQWISSKTIDYFTESDDVDAKAELDASGAEQVATNKKLPTADLTPKRIAAEPRAKRRPTPSEQYTYTEEIPGSGGLYGMISGALGAAASVAASRLPNPFGSVQDEEAESGVSTDQSDETSTIHSFHSFESDEIEDSSLKQAGETLTPSVTNSKADSTHSSESTAVRSTYAASQHDRELRKLEERKRKMEEKLRVAQERATAKRRNDAQRDEIAVQKLREKHEREVAKQEEKYQRELKRLEAKRASEQKKAEERRRKQAEREDRSNLAVELEKVRAERDLARKHVELLKEQIGDLQGQNTMLVARLGREGISISVDGGSAGAGVGGSSESLPVPPPVLRRAMTDRPDPSAKTNGLKS